MRDNPYFTAFPGEDLDFEFTVGKEMKSVEEREIKRQKVKANDELNFTREINISFMGEKIPVSK